MNPEPQELFPQLTSDSAKALSALGASKGGKARANSLSPEERKEIARRAVEARFPEGRLLYELGQARIKDAFRQSQNDPPMWGFFLLLVIGLLGAELAYTRSLAKKSGL